MNTIIKAAVTAAIFSMSSVAVAECDADSTFSGCSDAEYNGQIRTLDEGSLSVIKMLTLWGNHPGTAEKEEAVKELLEVIQSISNDKEPEFATTGEFVLDAITRYSEGPVKHCALYDVETSTLTIDNVGVLTEGQDENSYDIKVLDQVLFFQSGNSLNFKVIEYNYDGKRYDVR